MPVTTRTRALASPLEEVWEVIADPHHLPRWWPRVEGVEAVDAGAFTQVLRSNRGRRVRADYSVIELERPNRVCWRQELEGSPFERVLRRAEIEMTLADEGEDATRITLALTQVLGGASRFGGVMVRRASGKLLDDALDGLERIL